MTLKAVNVRNQFYGAITHVTKGPVVSELMVSTPAGIITSVISTRSLDAGLITIGTEVIALFKATDVSIAKL